MTIFQEIAFGSSDYRNECELRNQVLRIPIGMSLFDEDLTLEREQMHFGLFDPNRNLVACVIAVAFSPSEAKIRQMAVDIPYQGKGYGRQLIHSLENSLMQRGVSLVTLHARTTAVGFYEKMNYVKVGQAFLEVGIPHITMVKQLLRAKQ